MDETLDRALGLLEQTALRLADDRLVLIDALENSVAIMKLAQMVEQMRGQADSTGWDKPIAYAEKALAKAGRQS